jgi:hypothetical protein
MVCFLLLTLLLLLLQLLQPSSPVWGWRLAVLFPIWPSPSW